MGINVHLNLAATCQLSLLYHVSCMHQSVRSNRHKVDVAVHVSGLFAVMLLQQALANAALGNSILNCFNNTKNVT